jgi:uncharacterized protein involved in type VI secretion and phage assembly
MITPALTAPVSFNCGLLTRSSKGGAYGNANAIRFEDKKGEEQLWIHAEKNQDNEVENDETTDIGRDRTEHVGRHETVTIDGHPVETVISCALRSAREGLRRGRASRQAGIPVTGPVPARVETAAAPEQPERIA